MKDESKGGGKGWVDFPWEGLRTSVLTSGPPEVLIRPWRVVVLIEAAVDWVRFEEPGTLRSRDGRVCVGGATGGGPRR